MWGMCPKSLNRPRSQGRQKKIFRLVNGEKHAQFDHKCLVLEMSTVGSTRDMLTSQPPATKMRTETAMSQEPPHQSPDSTPVLICSITLQRGTEPPLKICTIGSNTPMLINALIDLGPIGQFIDIDYVQSKILCTQCLPRAIPVYNVDGTLN